MVATVASSEQARSTKGATIAIANLLVEHLDEAAEERIQDVKRVMTASHGGGRTQIAWPSRALTMSHGLAQDFSRAALQVPQRGELLRKGAVAVTEPIVVQRVVHADEELARSA